MLADLLPPRELERLEPVLLRARLRFPAPSYPSEALAAERPCQLYAHTASPIPTRTQGHHRRPQYLQRRVHDGQVLDQELMYLCGLCHDSVHDWISWLLGEARVPRPEPGWKAKAEARATVDWYLAAMLERAA